MAILTLTVFCYYQNLHRAGPDGKSAFRVHFSYRARGMYSIRIMQGRRGRDKLHIRLEGERVFPPEMRVRILCVKCSPGRDGFSRAVCSGWRRRWEILPFSGMH